MANVRDGITRPPKPVVEEIVPTSGWTEDSNGHYLLVDLPGFKKNQMKVQISNSTVIKVNGERPVNDNKHIRFELKFTVPENSDSEGITAKFDGEILYVVVPKHKVQEEKEPEPAGLKNQDVVPKHEAGGEKEHSPAGTKDQAVVRNAKVDEKKEPETASTKDQAIVPKAKEEEKKEPEPASTKDQDIVPKHETKKKKEPECADLKDHGVNGTTEESVHEKPNDNKAEKEDDNVLGNGRQFCRRKNREGIHKNAPMSFSEDTARRWEGEPSYLRSGMKMLNKNKGIVVTAMLAFALGAFISQKFKANEE